MDPSVRRMDECFACGGCGAEAWLSLADPAWLGALCQPPDTVPITQGRVGRTGGADHIYTHLVERGCTGILVKSSEDDVDFQQLRSTLESSVKERNQVPTETLGPVEFSQREEPGSHRDPGTSGVQPEAPPGQPAGWGGGPHRHTAGVLYAGQALRAASHFPCFAQMGAEGAHFHFYGLLSNECPGLMKNCYHMGSEMEHKERVRQTDRTDILLLSQFVSLYLSGLEPEPALVESCLYTVTPDHHFVLDRHPHHGNIVIRAGFLCHGFKFGLVVGKVLCKLSHGEMNLSPFKIQWFQSNHKSSL
nr:LOW QUALITY PROTEIN: uncharacterized protein LOC111979999 [Salvelinus alpinus]